MNTLEKALIMVDTLSEQAGRACRILPIALMVVVVYDVVARYFFNRPTIWGMELNGYFLLGMASLGGGYALLYDSHIRVTIIYDKFSPRGKAAVDLFTYIGLFSFCLILFIYGGRIALSSIQKGTVSASIWAPLLWPSQILVPIGAAMIFLQGLANWIRNLYLVTTGRSLEK